MKTISLKELQELEFGILKYIKDICSNNGLRYYLAYGTLIGAARHQGFIPWDDDIDIMMPRDDYNRLVEIMKNNIHPFYKLISVQTEDEFTAPLPKIIDIRTVLIQNYTYIEKIQLGVYIDIFILDGATDRMEDARRHAHKAYALQKKWAYADTKMFLPGRSKMFGILLWIHNLPYKFKGIHFWIKKIETHDTKFSFDKSRYVAVLNYMVYGIDKSVWMKEDFDMAEVLMFEGEEFMVPKNYDKILRQIYGDYMELPPEEKRISHHDYIVYWRA